MRLSAYLLLPAWFLMMLAAVPCHSQDTQVPSNRMPGEYAAFIGMTIKEIRIEFTDCPWCTGTLKNLSRDLISLREGGIFTGELYEQSVDAIMLSKRFEESTVHVESLEDGLTVTYLLKPYRQIKDIRISNEYPLFKSDVLKAMGVYSGDALLKDTLTEQERLIAELYKKEGYIKPHVSVRADEAQESGSVILNVGINPGPYYHLDSLTIEGNHAILDAEIKSRMNTWRTSFFIQDEGRYIESEFSTDLKELLSVYRQRGYPECEIRESVNKDESNGSVSAVVTISEGPYYEISFSGNKWFWSYTLRSDMPVFVEGNRRDRVIKNGIKKIKKRYQDEGFLSAEVEILEEKVTTKHEKVRRLDFLITEGPRTLVDSVAFSGNNSFGDDALKKIMQTGKAPFYGDKVFNPDVLEEDLASIRAFYLKRGYNDAAVSKELSWSNDRSSVSVTVKIAEGVRTVISSLKILGLENIPEPKAREVLQLTEGGPFRSDLIKADEHALSGLISENGHPYVKVRTDVVLSAGKTDASITFHVEEGKKAIMGNIYYRGNFKTRTSAIRRELGIEPGQPFSLKAMLEGQRNIRDMQAFDSVQFRTFGIKEEQDTVTLLIDMEEIKPYYFQAATGYASDRGLYGNTRFGDRNLFGLNKEAWLGGELSQTGYEGELGVTQHRIFGMPITNTNSLSYEKKEEFNQIFGTSVSTAALSFSHEYDRNITTSLGFRYEWRDQFLQKSSYSIPEGDEDSYQPRGALITTPFVSYDTRDSFVRPKSGFYSSYAVDISKGYQNSLDNFLKHYVNLRYYISPTHRITLAWLGRMGYIYTFGKRSELPSDQLFYLGGTMDVRGYDENMLRYDAQENPIGGRLSVTGSMETRIEITRSWETALFIDTGSVRRALTEEGADTFRSSAGIGLRYITPIGPMGLLYGHKLNPEKDESQGRFHFSVGYTF